jgi:hypothetical protein
MLIIAGGMILGVIGLVILWLLVTSIMDIGILLPLFMAWRKGKKH